MGEVKKSEKVKLIMGMLSGEISLFDLVQERLSKRFGPIDFESELMPFNHTNYYQSEMGKDLKRKFIGFQNLIEPDDIVDIKISTNELEKELASVNGRRINLDPGYLGLSKLILASTKNHQHRIYLGRGIYGEVTLRYSKGSFQPWPWTYPDYKTKDYIQIFNQIRKIYSYCLNPPALSGEEKGKRERRK